MRRRRSLTTVSRNGREGFFKKKTKPQIFFGKMKSLLLLTLLFGGALCNRVIKSGGGAKSAWIASFAKDPAEDGENDAIAYAVGTALPFVGRAPRTKRARRRFLLIFLLLGNARTLKTQQPQRKTTLRCSVHVRGLCQRRQNVVAGRETGGRRW